MTLSNSVIQAFEHDGFVGPIDVLTADECGEVRAAIADVIQNLPKLSDQLYEVEQAHTERPGEVVCHFLGGFRVHPVLRALITNPRITAPCAELLGVQRLRFFHDQVFAKPPHHPGVVPWHQDYSYWQRTEPVCHITMNLLLDDSDAASGCLQFIPGSHRLGLLPPLPFDAPLETVREHLPSTFEWNPVAMPVRAGQATIHHSHTLHGSAANNSERWRRAAVLNFIGSEVRVADDSQPLLRGVPHIAKGEVIEGDDFPIVYPCSPT